MRFPALRAGIVGAGLIAACGGSQALDMAYVSAFVKNTISMQTGASVKAVRCPEKQARKQGDSFDCTVDIDHGSTTATITQVDDRGSLSLAMKQSIVRASDVEKAIAAAIKAQGNLDAVVDCGPRFRPSVPNDTFACIGRAGGEQAKYRVTIGDAKGNVTFVTEAVSKMVPPPAVSAGPAGR